MDSRGFFSNVDPIFAEHGKDSEVWRTLVNEKVNFLFVFLRTFLFVLVTAAQRPSRERPVHRQHIRSCFADAGNEASALHCLTVAHYNSLVRYNVEPFYWSSSLNWIPSRFQADVQPKVGDSKR